MKFRNPKWKKNKTWKHAYTKSKRFDVTCRNHGGCGYCRNTRTYHARRTLEAIIKDLEDWYNDNETEA